VKESDGALRVAEKRHELLLTVIQWEHGEHELHQIILAEHFKKITATFL
jgi:hypothetical protein